MKITLALTINGIPYGVQTAEIKSISETEDFDTILGDIRTTVEEAVIGREVTEGDGL